MALTEMKTTSAIGKALTFIELLVVLVIIGVMTGISVPGFRRTFDSLEFDNFVKDVYYLNHYLKSTAISARKIYILGIDPAKAVFTASLRDEETGKAEKLSGKFGKAYAAPKGVTLAVQPAEKTQVYFYPDGSADAVEITLKGKYDKAATLSIEGALGEIKVK